MPKLVVLFSGEETLASAAADGASSVRFSEVDVRQIGSSSNARKRLESVEQVREYDGVVIVGAGHATDAHALLDALERIEPPDVFANTVLAVIGDSDESIVARAARLGGILVSEPRGSGEPIDRARATGKRTAKVVEWVRHALSHEHAHSHHHH